MACYSWSLAPFPSHCSHTYSHTLTKRQCEVIIWVSRNATAPAGAGNATRRSNGCKNSAKCDKFVNSSRRRRRRQTTRPRGDNCGRRQVTTLTGQYGKWSPREQSEASAETEGTWNCELDQTAVNWDELSFSLAQTQLTQLASALSISVVPIRK